MNAPSSPPPGLASAPLDPPPPEAAPRVASPPGTAEQPQALRAENEGMPESQWLVTNGQGGYASATIGGKCTWKYHGLLIAALPAPLGRTVMLNQLTESWGLNEAGAASAAPFPAPRFRFETGLPIWQYALADGVMLEKRLLMPFLQNTVHVTYRHLGKTGTLHLRLQLALHFRPFEGDPGTVNPKDYSVRVSAGQFEFRGPAPFPPLRVRLVAPRFQLVTDGGSASSVRYPLDADRGYSADGQLWSPGFFWVRLDPGQSVTLIGSTEEWATVFALSPEDAAQTERERRERLSRICHPAAKEGLAADLVLAADQFIVTPAGRVADSARARAHGDELRSVIAGYHWFGDWGRDTMISLEGLTLSTGRWEEAGWILRTFSRYVRDGLIPNLFPEGTNQGLYHTADATLWFFQATHRYVEVTGDRETLRALLPIFQDIVEHHLRGTDFGIGVDPADGLLKQGQDGYQLTWMDAKVGDWVVTPRRGKAVEINALWYNALKLLENWSRQEGAEAAGDALAAQAATARASFNRRFWNQTTGYLFDVVDTPAGNDDSLLRPNQLLAISLQHPVLEPERWAAVLQAVEQHLVTPMGLRSLSPGAPQYKARYWGDLRSRDAAYHQGTVWAWLIGPFIDAWLKAHPERKTEARKFLGGFVLHLDEACVGTISEIFDAESPYAPRGCISQAWSVAEVLRSWINTA